MARTPALAATSETMSRRSVLKGGTALALSFSTGFASKSALANPIALGEAEVQIFSDGNLSLPMGFILPDQNSQEIEALLEPHGMATGFLTPDCNITLYRAGDRLALFDVGAGPNFQPSAGKLLTHLENAGIDPAEITDVIFTHAHPDHLWGVLDDFDDPLFSEAQYWVPQAEWEYWLADDTLANMPEERKTFVVGAQNRFEAISDQVEMIRPDMEVIPGVEAVDTSGHTPGHMSYMLHDGSESLLVVGDAIANSVISFEKPDWHYGADQDQDKGAATRRALLDRIAAENTRIIGYHLPQPGMGRAEHDGTAYRFVVDA